MGGRSSESVSERVYLLMSITAVLRRRDDLRARERRRRRRHEEAGVRLRFKTPSAEAFRVWGCVEGLGGLC